MEVQIGYQLARSAANSAYLSCSRAMVETAVTEEVLDAEELELTELQAEWAGQGANIPDQVLDG